MRYICLNCGEINESLACPHCGYLSSIEKYNEVISMANRAIRYGYYYRKIAEREMSNNRDIRINYNIVSPTNFLEWIAALVISGVTFDIIKFFVKRLYSAIKSKCSSLDKDEENIIEIISNEEELSLFVKYTKEFYTGLRNVDQNVVDYIQEEMDADFKGHEVGKILDKEHRIPNTQDFLNIYKMKEKCSIDIHFHEDLELFSALKKHLHIKKHS